MPLYTTFTGNFGFGRAQQLTFNTVDLIAFSNWHQSNASTIAQSDISNCYFYLYDGGANYITDGGNSMWLTGNYISLGGTQTASTIAYGSLVNTPPSNYGYFVSQAGVWPQISLGYVKVGTVLWSNAGAIGTGGNPNASNTNFDGSFNTSNQARYVSYWANQTYGVGTPTIAYVWFTIGQSNLNTVYASSNDGRKTLQPPALRYTQYYSITGSNFVFGQFLLSAYDSNNYPNGPLIPQVQVETFLSNYVQNAFINIF
jgi:hypothetical protein